MLTFVSVTAVACVSLKFIDPLLGGLYDRQRLNLKPMSNTCVVGAAVPPGNPGIGGGLNCFPTSPRLTRLMVVIAFHAMSTSTLQSVYCNLFQTWLEDFPAYSLSHHHQIAKVCGQFNARFLIADWVRIRTLSCACKATFLV